MEFGKKERKTGGKGGTWGDTNRSHRVRAREDTWRGPLTLFRGKGPLRGRTKPLWCLGNSRPVSHKKRKRKKLLYRGRKGSRGRKKRKYTAQGGNRADVFREKGRGKSKRKIIKPLGKRKERTAREKGPKFSKTGTDDGTSIPATGRKEASVKETITTFRAQEKVGERKGGKLV